jgi:transcriptional regulator with XRE-family HTH domain
MNLEKFVIDNIRRIRQEKGISQERLAEACNTATSYIGLMETYRNVPKLSTIEKIAKALGVNPLAFFQDYSWAPAVEEKDIQRKKQKILTVLDREIDMILRQ